MKSPKIKTQKLPEQLRFNNLPIIVLQEELQRHWAYLDPRGRTIHVNNSIPITDEFLFELVIHEFMHAAIYESHLTLDKAFHGHSKPKKRKRSEEILVDQLARDVTQLLYRNPELLQLLQEKKKKHESKQSKAGRRARSLRSQ